MERRMQAKKIGSSIQRASAACVVASLAGCAAMPDERGEIKLNEHRQETEQEWQEDAPPVHRVQGRSGVNLRPLSPLPQKMANQQVSFELASSANLSDLQYILSEQGLPIHIRPSNLDASGQNGQNRQAEKLAQMELGHIRFEGTVGELQKTLEEVYDIAVDYGQGYLILRKHRPYMITLPQNRDLIKAVKGQLQSQGARQVSADIDSGVVHYHASPSEHGRIQKHIDRFVQNAAIVQLQLALIDLRINQDRGQGFDWESLSARIGAIGGVESGEGDSSSEQMLPTTESRTTLDLSANGLSMTFENEDVDVNAVLRALSHYGEARTEQDVTLSTLAGSEVTLRSGETIPYVDEIQTTQVGDSGVATGANISTTEDGLEIAVTPFYDNENNVVSSYLDISLTELIEIKRFSIGILEGAEHGGELSHPHLRDLSFSTISRLAPGESAFIGGISYETSEDQYTTLSGLEELPSGSKQSQGEEHAMFILIRPTVTLFVDEDEWKLPSHGSTQPCPAALFQENQPIDYERVDEVQAVFFPTALSTLEPDAKRYLRGLAQRLEDDERLHVIGYADAIGGDAVNDRIAQARTQSIQQALINYGVDAEQITTQGNRYCNPAEHDERKRHRRGEIWIYEAEGSTEDTAHSSDKALEADRAQDQADPALSPEGGDQTERGKAQQ